MADDKELGYKVHKHLADLGIETPTNGGYKIHQEDPLRMIDTEKYGRLMLDAIGLDLTDDSMKSTPDRLAKMYINELFWGLDYRRFPACTVVDNKMNYQEMVVRDGCDVKSMCEHHFLPIVGKATVAYLPKEKVLGLSKMDRIVEFFSRRPQVQERLTEQIAATLKLVLDTENVAVVIRAEHFCVSHRGVQGSNSTTVTSRLHGKFMTVDSLRQEFLALTR